MALPLLACHGLLLAQAPEPATTTFASAAIVYDQARDRLVVVTRASTLWEWDGVDWGIASVTLPATPRNLVYDADRRSVYSVCGSRLVQYDGHAIVDRGPLPPQPGNLFLVAERGRNRLLGCVAANGIVAAFEWDGVAWQSLPSPSPGLPIGIAYDEARQRVVLQTLTVQLPVTIRTLEWDGTAWSQAVVNPRAFLPAAYDSFRQRVTTFTTGQNYEWTGTQWSPIAMQAPVAGTPTADPAHGRIWLYSLNTAGDQSRMFAWDGTTWTSPMLAPHPMDLPTGCPLTYDAARDRAVLLGGFHRFAHHEWDGTRWREPTPALSPPARTLHAQAYDAASGETVVFGGSTPGGAIGDTWAWNGIQWRLAASSGPSARYGAACTYDSLRGVVVLIGGEAGSTSYTDHWEWNGSTWTQVATTTPLGGLSAALGHDPLRNLLVYVDWSGTTHERRTTGWTMVTPANPILGNGSRNSLTWDPVRQRLQGELHSGSTMVTHEWTGTAWVSRGTNFGATAWDSRRGAMLGWTEEALLVDSPQPAAISEFGTPCGGAAIATSLAAFGRPRPGDTAFHLDLRAEAALRPAMLGFAFTAGNQPLGNGCTLLLQNPFAAAVWFTDAQGCWHHPLPLANSLALRGVVLVAQGAVLDPASPGGIALSQGLQFTVGD